MESPDITPPEIRLLGGQNLTVDYGIPAAASLEVCPSESTPEALAGGVECWATATDDVDGDVTARMTVRQLDVGGASCAPDAAMAAVCAPGTYVYLYHVMDGAGNIGVATVTVYLVVRTRIQFEDRMTTAAIAAGPANAEAAALVVTGSPSNLAYRAALAERLTQATGARPGEEVQAADVTVERAEVLGVRSSRFDLRVAVAVEMKSLGATTDRGRRRRLMQVRVRTISRR